MLREVDTPRPGPSDALIRIEAVGICETDVHMTLHPASHAETPRIMGHEWSGTLEQAPTWSSLREGSRVVGEGMVGCGTCRMCRVGRTNLCVSYREIGFSLPGAYAEYLVLPAANLHGLPASMSFEEGAMVEPTAVALHAVDMSGMTAGDRVAVLGPGPIGLLCVQIVRALGAGRVVLTGTRDDRLAVGLGLGADRAINVREVEPVAEILRDIPGGPEVVMDAAGTAASFDQATRSVGKGGTVVLIGGWEQVTWSPGMLIGKEIVLKGSLASPGTWPRAMELVGGGKVKVLPLVTHRFDLSRIAEAFHLVDRRENVVKAVLLPRAPVSCVSSPAWGA